MSFPSIKFRLGQIGSYSKFFKMRKRILIIEYMAQVKITIALHSMLQLKRVNCHDNTILSSTLSRKCKETAQYRESYLT